MSGGAARRVGRALAVSGAAVAAVGVLAGPAAAHPLGNFTTNTSAALTVAPDAVAVNYVLDLAEIPALRVVQELDGDGDGAVSAAEGVTYERDECADLAAGITLALAGEALILDVEHTALHFPEGEAGLATLRLECALAAGVAWEGSATLAFADANLEGRSGWREVTATGDAAALLDSDVPQRSSSDRLRRYPQDRLAAPLDVRAATLLVRSGGAQAAQDGGVGVTPPEGLGVARLADGFTRLVAARELTLGVGALAVLTALALGGLHALAPGHGKTVMAAYLLGKQASARQLLGLALTVAVTHTLGVLVLGAVVGVTEILAPDRLYAWLGVASGLLFALVGVTLLRGSVRGRHHPHIHEPVPAGAAAHDHGHDHDHDCGHPHGHEHGAFHGHGHAAGGRGVGWRGLIAPGLAGGLVPTPSALVVLLGGMTLDRTWFGVLLVLAYGVGMAALLVSTGWVLLHARDRLAARATTGRLAEVARVLPVATAALLVIGGLAIATRAATAAL